MAGGAGAPLPAGGAGGGGTGASLCGGRTKDDLLCITEFERLGVECYVATEDGSLGERGLVTRVLEQRLEVTGNRGRIFACGPHGMLKAVAAIAARRTVPCQVSLEGYMACGMGACLGCVCQGTNHSAETPDYRCVCTEGLVFDANVLKWEEAAMKPDLSVEIVSQVAQPVMTASGALRVRRGVQGVRRLESIGAFVTGGCP